MISPRANSEFLEDEATLGSGWNKLVARAAAGISGYPTRG